MNQISDNRQTLFTAVVPPCMIMAATGILLAVGYALCPQSMQGGPVTGVFGVAGLILVRVAGAVTDNAGFLFAGSAAFAYTRHDPKEGALYGVCSFLILSALSSSYLVTSIVPSCAELAESLVYLPAPLTGFLCGRLAAGILNRAGNQTFDRPRTCLIVLASATVVSFVLIGIWMVAWFAVTKVGIVLSDGSTSSVALFTVLNRLLMPFDLHHALNRIVLFQEGSGDLVRYWANQTTGDPGRYMSGFFAPMMFGLPSIAFYLYRSETQKALGKQYLAAAAVCSFLIGFSEPLEFLLFFTVPGFYVLYCLLYGLFGALTVFSGFRAGFALSGGFCDLIFSAACPAAAHTWLIVPLGLLAAVLFYRSCWIVSRIRISKNR